MRGSWRGLLPNTSRACRRSPLCAAVVDVQKNRCGNSALNVRSVGQSSGQKDEKSLKTFLWINSAYCVGAFAFLLVCWLRSERKSWCTLRTLIKICHSFKFGKRKGTLSTDLSEVLDCGPVGTWEIKSREWVRSYFTRTSKCIEECRSTPRGHPPTPLVGAFFAFLSLMWPWHRAAPEPWVCNVGWKLIHTCNRKKCGRQLSKPENLGGRWFDEGTPKRSVAVGRSYLVPIWKEQLIRLVDHCS